jgi:ornithine cyclodeaminase/alanine dehydrogenase-like protein (mu-crystallin family)
MAAAIPIVGVDHLRTLVSFEDLIEPMSFAFQQSSAGQADNGLIVMFPLADRTRGDVYVKTGTLADAPFHMVKISPWFAANAEQGKPQGGFIAVLDSHTGHTLALLDDQHYLSDIRTAAAGALAACALAPMHVATASVLGSGVQAYWQTLALHHERRFSALRIWARDAAKADQLALRLAARLEGVAIAVESDLERAVRFGDVLITATMSREPLVRGEWLRSGQHITAIGADDSTKCELDATALRRAHVFVDAIDATIANGDVHHAIATGGYARHDLAGEIGDVLAHRIIGRQSADEITIAKFVGIGAQDLMAAGTVMEKLGPCRD